MRADIARREFEIREGAQPPPRRFDGRNLRALEGEERRERSPAAARRRPREPSPRRGERRSRSRSRSGGEERDTIAVLNYRQKDLDPDVLHDWFSKRRGFMMLHAYERINTVFAKFKSHEDADVALESANDVGFGAEWARRNLRVSKEDLAQAERREASPGLMRLEEPTVRTARDKPRAILDKDRGGHKGKPRAILDKGAGGAKRPMKRRRSRSGSRSESPKKKSRANLQAPRQGRDTAGDVDTIAILGFKEKRLDANYLTNWFAKQRGFVALHANDRIPAVFVKFDSPRQAGAALRVANEAGFGAEWARRNLDL